MATLNAKVVSEEQAWQEVQVVIDVDIYVVHGELAERAMEDADHGDFEVEDVNAIGTELEFKVATDTRVNVADWLVDQEIVNDDNWEFDQYSFNFDRMTAEWSGDLKIYGTINARKEL